MEKTRFDVDPPDPKVARLAFASNACAAPKTLLIQHQVAPSQSGIFLALFKVDATQGDSKVQ